MTVWRRVYETPPVTGRPMLVWAEPPHRPVVIREFQPDEFRPDDVLGNWTLADVLPEDTKAPLATHWAFLPSPPAEVAVVEEGVPVSADLMDRIEEGLTGAREGIVTTFLAPDPEGPND